MNYFATVNITYNIIQVHKCLTCSTSYIGKEEIDDIETFLSLNDNDFTRIKMTTKMVKIVQKVQNQLRDGKEEWITEEVEASPTKPQIDETNTNQINTPHNVDPNNPYKDISLEKVSNMSHLPLF